MQVSAPSLSYRARLDWLKRVAIALALGAGVAGCNNTDQAAGGSPDTIAWSTPGSTGSTVTPAGTTTGAATATPSGPPIDWRTNLSGDVITVELRDLNDFYRVERVELVGPTGMTVAASEIDRETNRQSGDYGGGGYGPSLGFGVGSWSGSGGRSSGSATGVGLGFDFPLGGGSSSSAPPPVVTFTRARIRVPDESFYRQTAASWVVRVTTTDRNNQQNTAVFPAPKPVS